MSGIAKSMETFILNIFQLKFRFSLSLIIHQNEKKYEVNTFHYFANESNLNCFSRNLVPLRSVPVYPDKACEAHLVDESTHPGAGGQQQQSVREEDEVTLAQLLRRNREWEVISSKFISSVAWSRAIRLLFTEGHISFRVALRGPHILKMTLSGCIILVYSHHINRKI